MDSTVSVPETGKSTGWDEATGEDWGGAATGGADWDGDATRVTLPGGGAVDSDLHG